MGKVDILANIVDENKNVVYTTVIKDVECDKIDRLIALYISIEAWNRAEKAGIKLKYSYGANGEIIKRHE